MKIRKLFWIILPLSLLVFGPLVYLFCMPSLVGVAGVLVKAAVTDRENFGYLLRPIIAIELDAHSTKGGTVLSQYGFSITVSTDMKIQVYNEDEPIRAYAIAEKKYLLIISPENAKDPAFMRQSFQSINEALEKKCGMTVEEAYNVSLDSEYECYRTQYSLWAGNFSLIQNEKNVVAQYLINTIGYSRPHGPVYLLDHDGLKGFLKVYPGSDDKSMLQYSFFRERDLNSQYAISFLGDFTPAEVVAIVSTIRFDEEAHS